MSNLNANTRLIFIHIPKTAGTSFGQVIESNSGEPYRYRGLRRMLTEDLSGYSVIQGHMAHGIHRFLSGKAIYVTFLRDPVEQCISYYYFSRSWVGQPDYRDAVDYDLAGFYRLKHHQNMQTKHIGGYAPFAMSNLFPGPNLVK